jgi:hypothetical protein
MTGTESWEGIDGKVNPYHVYRSDEVDTDWGTVSTVGDTVVAGEHADLEIEVTVDREIPAGHRIEL